MELVKKCLKLLIIIIAIFLLLVNVVLIFTYDFLNYDLPEFLSYRLFIQQSNSLNSIIEKDAVVLAKRISVDQLKVDDIVVYYNETENIYSCNKVENVDIASKTITIKNDNKEIVEQKNIKGKYITSYMLLGKFLKINGALFILVISNLILIGIFILIYKVLK